MVTRKDDDMVDARELLDRVEGVLPSEVVVCDVLDDEADAVVAADEEVDVVGIETMASVMLSTAKVGYASERLAVAKAFSTRVPKAEVL
mmetsp:Transcript_40357/g.94874  ORF Transcript_40357/g.94874 Transcript_40357/m.94874 type:complete len:89 (+) Transcript_40357:177-443(+)